MIGAGMAAIDGFVEQAGDLASIRIFRCFVFMPSAA
jgi:hypothetical protein